MWYESVRQCSYPRLVFFNCPVLFLTVSSALLVRCIRLLAASTPFGVTLLTLFPNFFALLSASAWARCLSMPRLLLAVSAFLRSVASGCGPLVCRRRYLCWKAVITLSIGLMSFSTCARSPIKQNRYGAAAL